MSSNIFQIFTANPSSSLINTDLLYLGKRPWDATDDSAISWENVKNTIISQLPIILTESITTATQALSPNRVYIANYSTGNLTFTLPVNIEVGQTITIIGALNGWRINQNANQQINLQSSSTTLGATGYIESNLPTDCVTLVCVQSDLVFTALSVGNITIM